MRAADYAPDVNVLGIAALAPATDLKALVASGQSSMFGKIVSSFLVQAYSSAYPEIDAGFYVKARARPLAKDISSRCVGGWGTLLSVLETALLPSDGIFAHDPTGGPLGERLLQNMPYGPIRTPVLIAQGQIDDLVLPDVQRRFVAARPISQSTTASMRDATTYPWWQPIPRLVSIWSAGPVIDWLTRQHQPTADNDGASSESFIMTHGGTGGSLQGPLSAACCFV